jgi:putative FmdB family regulatory protein
VSERATVPIYEYECRECGHEFEELMRHTDPDPACPACGQVEVQKLISHTSFQLKGSGWYATDYKARPKPRDGNSSDGPSSKGDSSSGGGSGSESKSERAAA